MTGPKRFHEDKCFVSRRGSTGKRPVGRSTYLRGDPKRALVCPRLPPLDGTLPNDRRTADGATLARLGRLAACLVALALPVIGIAAAETVHRVGTPKTMQAAAAGPPSQDAAVLDGVSRTGSPVREAFLLTPGRETRR